MIYYLALHFVIVFMINSNVCAVESFGNRSSEEKAFDILRAISKNSCVYKIFDMLARSLEHVTQHVLIENLATASRIKIDYLENQKLGPNNATLDNEINTITQTLESIRRTKISYALSCLYLMKNVVLLQYNYDLILLSELYYSDLTSSQQRLLVDRSMGYASELMYLQNPMLNPV